MKALRLPSLIFVAILSLCLTAEPAHAQCEIQAVKYLGSVETGAAYAVEVAGQYAYVAGREGLKVVDISDSLSPQIVGSVNVPTEYSDLIVSGIYAYLTSWEGELYIINISDPAHPSVTSSLSAFDAYAVDVSGSYAYCVDGFALRVVDISDPSTPLLVATETFSRGSAGWAIDVSIAGSYAFVANQSSMTVLDISNPLAPLEVVDVPTLYYAVGVTIEGCNAFVETFGGMEIFDISNPVEPYRAGSLDLGGGGWVAVNGSKAFNGSAIIDVSNPSAPFLMNMIFAGVLNGMDYQTFYDMEFSGNIAYAACAPTTVGGGPGKLQIIDFSTPYALPKFHELELEGANSVAVADGFAYVTKASENSLAVIDFSDLSAPQVVGSTLLPVSPNDIALSGSYAFIAGSSLGVVDISNPTDPQVITTLDNAGLDIVLSEMLAYVATGATVDIIDISEPGGPALISSTSTLYPAQGVAISGQYAYVADGVGLEV